ncbi:MAG: hypothetical protein ACO3ND_09430, partial [Opitutales bacterium]
MANARRARLAPGPPWRSRAARPMLPAVTPRQGTLFDLAPTRASRLAEELRGFAGFGRPTVVEPVEASAGSFVVPGFRNEFWTS